MSKYETLAEQLFGSSDDDADLHDLHTQQDNRLTFHSPLSSVANPPVPTTNLYITMRWSNLTDSDDEASNHRRVDQNLSDQGKPP
jgi:hypothetical protein